MKVRLILSCLAAAVAAACLAAPAPALLVGIYRNDLDTVSQRSELRRLSGRACERGGSQRALRMVIGKRTRECSYRTPVVGRDLEIAATERLLSGTPKRLQKKVFLAVNLRSGGGSQYQLAVYPLQRKFQLRKNIRGGGIHYLEIGKNVPSIKGLNKANELRLRAFNVTRGPDRGACRLLAYVGDRLVARVLDPRGGILQGRASSVSFGAARAANGAVASVDDVVVRVPSPF